MAKSVVLATFVGAGLSLSSATAQTPLPPPAIVAATGGGNAADQMNTLGPEGQALSTRTGLWSVAETVWEQPGAAPVTSNAMVAERRMVGSFLQESLRPADAAADAPAKRMDYLGFNRTEGRWDYLSLETRVPVGLMPAWSFDQGDPDRIVVTFLPFAVSGNGSDVTGQMLRMEQVITRQGPDHDVKDQYFILANGHATRWLAHRYSYVRRH